MTNSKKRILQLVLIALCLFSFTSSLFAIEVAQVEPAKVRLSVAPGTSKAGTIKVYNLSSDAKNIKAYFEDWVYLPVCDGTKDFRPAGTTKLSASDWITFSPSEFSVSPYGKQTVNYTVKVPQDASGGHYAVLFFESFLQEPGKDEEGVNVDVAVRIASLFYVEPEGTVSRKLDINNLKVSNDKNRFQINARLTNNGNVDINTKATFFVIDNKGMVFARGEFNEVYTLPGDAALMTGEYPKAIPPGKYDVVLTIDISKALEGSGIPKPPAITKELGIEVGEDGEVAVAEPLK